MNNKDPQDKTHWHLDKRVPLAIIFTLIGQLALGLILGTLMWAQVNTNTEDIADYKILTPYIYSLVQNMENMADDVSELKETINELAKELRENNNK